MKNEKIILYGAHAIPTIICLRLINKLSFAIHMLLIFYEIRLLFEFTNIGYYFSNKTGGAIIIIFLCLIPLITHILYIWLTKFGYAVLHSDHAEIRTKTSKKSISYYNSLTLQEKKIMRIPFSPNYKYYKVKMIFEENGETHKIHLYTDKLDYFNILTEKFCKPD